MIIIIKKFNCVLYFLLILFTTNTFSQDVNGNDCDTNRVSIENIRRLYADSFDDKTKDPRYTYKTPVIIIARLGVKEKSAIYNHRRLREIKDYLVSPAIGIPENLIITAQAERVKKGEGLVEVYYGGILQILIKLKNKESLQLLKCYY